MQLRRKMLVALAATPLIAGGFVLQIGKPSTNQEALSRNAALVVRGYACAEAEKTKVSGTAEGIVDGARESIPLKLIPISGQGMYAVTQQWPSKGKWVLTFTMTNPRFGEQSAMLKVGGGAVNWTEITRLSRAPTNAEVEAALQERAETAQVQR
ncbi:MAG: hypothetical protein JO340_13750 [Acidobacteriaceae bacterium]|nr:hypothetical protein [Acidobacteriaceae bacterium]